MPGIDMVLNGNPPASPFGFLYKIITTSVTFAAGGIGGIVTPIFFVGAQAGAMLADFLHVDSATLAALGLVAVLAPYATVACVISFLVTGQQSIYPSQRISLDSGKSADGPSMPIDYGKRLQHTKIPYRKTMFKQAFKQMVKHLIPNPKGFDDEK